MDRPPNFIEGDVDRAQIGPGVVTSDQFIRTARWRVAIQLDRQAEARRAFFNPFGREADLVFLRSGYRLSGVSGQIVSELCLNPSPNDPGIYHHRIAGPYGGIMPYSRQKLEQCVQRLLREYLNKTDGHLSDSFIEEAREVMEQCMRDQIEGKRLQDVGLTFVQVKALRESKAFQAHSHYAEFESRFAELQQELEAARRKALFETTVRDWHGPEHEERYPDQGYGGERTYRWGPEGDQAHRWDSKRQRPDIYYDLEKMEARLQEVLGAYLEATGGEISEAFIRQTLRLAENYSKIRPSAEVAGDRWLDSLPTSLAQRVRAMVKRRLKTQSRTDADVISAAWRNLRSALKNPKIALQCAQLGVLLPCLPLIKDPRYLSLMKTLAQTHPHLPHPWTSHTYQHYVPHPWAEEKCGGHWELLPGLDQTFLPVLNALIKSNVLWRARNQKARDDLFRSIGGAIASIGKGGMAYRYAPDRGTIQERLALLRQNLKHGGPLTINAVATTFRTDEEKLALQTALEAEPDSAFSDLLRRILAEQLEGVTHWSRTIQHQCKIGDTIFMHEGTEYSYCRKNPWGSDKGSVVGA